MITTNNASAKEWIFLCLAIAVTVLFVVFAEPVFTSFYLGSDRFADAMYDYNLYFTLSIYISILAWAFAILYYWIIDHVKLSSFVGWGFFCLLCVALAPAVAYFYPMSVFEADNLDFAVDLPGMAIVSIPVALVLFFIVSIGCKGFSTNCSTRPF